MRRTNFLDQRQVAGGAGPGTVEIDDVQQGCTGVLPFDRHLDWCAVLRFTIKITLLQTDRVTAADIDGRNDDHQSSMPLVVGTPFSRGSRLVAQSKARANALNTPSKT